MKQTWKKLAGLTLAAACAFGLAACGDKEETGGFQRITDEMAQNCVTVSQSAVESLASFDDSQMEQMAVSRDDFTRYAVEEWVEAVDTMGEYQSMGEAETAVDDEAETVTVTIPAVFEGEEATLTFVYDYNADYDQMTPTYMTVAEKETVAGNLQEAGINTIVGIVVVFVVLIFLVFVISLFRFVGGEEKKEAAKSEPAPAPAAAPAPAPAPAQAALAAQQSLPDDVELAIVLATAIAAAEEETSTDGYVVRSIRKVNGSKWRRA